MVLEFRENSTLTHDRLHTPLRQDPRFAHLFHCEHVRVLGPLVLDFPYFTKATLTNALLVLEEVLADSCMNTNRDKRLFKYYGREV